MTLAPPQIASVSVCVITYNHELFISECIESILNQETTFEIEIIVSNDLSTDNTEKIISEYIKKDNRITLLKTNERLGVISNWIKCLSNAKGKYVAVIEGDDYWTDSKKLQKQFDFIEKNPTLSFCFHKLKMKFERENAREEYLFQDLEEKEYDIYEVISKKWFIGTCSIFYRNSSLPKPFPKWVHGLKGIDKPIQLMLAHVGNIGFINEFMGVYRIHNNGVSQVQWLGKERIFEMSQIETLDRFDAYTHKKYHTFIYNHIYNLYNKLIEKNKKFKKEYIRFKFKHLVYKLKSRIL